MELHARRQNRGEWMPERTRCKAPARLKEERRDTKLVLARWANSAKASAQPVCLSTQILSRETSLIASASIAKGVDLSK